MRYLTLEEYVNLGYPKADTLDFTKAEKRAVSTISRLTPRLRHYFNTYAAQPDGFVKQSVKEAIATQIEQGLADISADEAGGFSTVSIGRMSIKADDTKSGSGASGGGLSPDIRLILSDTGLLYSGVVSR